MLQTFKSRGSTLIPSDRPSRRDRTGPYTTLFCSGIHIGGGFCKFLTRHVCCGHWPLHGLNAGFPAAASSWVEVHMRSRTLVGLMVVIGLAAAVNSHGAPTRRWASVYLAEPTLIGATIVQGPVLFVHDDLRMARGEPCTTVQLLDPARGPLEEIAAFHCIPLSRKPASKFTLTTRPNTEIGYGCVLTEYQFAGDNEGHGVPLPRFAH
jgi:hypothetical protein